MKKMLFAKDVRGVIGALLLLALPCAVVISTRALAASAAPTAENTGLEEIIVTAEKRESTVQATPIAMTALSAGDLSQENITSIQDLVGAIPGISLRTAGPGQTEYEMRGLASSGGSVATVGFYIDETPLSASAVALNGRTVIDADLYDLNRAEILRGPQGTLYGAGSMGGTIKLVTNQPKLHTFEGSAYVDASQTTGGSTNGRGSLMLNIPLGDIASLRFVTTGKYISGWIHRDVIAEGQFPFPTNFGNCGVYYCTRGDVQGAPVAHDIANSNLERFVSSRAALLVQPSDVLSITGNFMYQRIDADGYNNYQAVGNSPAGNQSIYQPNDIKEPYYDAFHMFSLKVSYDLSFANLTSASSYWKRDVYQATDSTEALQNIFNYTAFVPNIYSENDRTWQLAQELRLTSRGDGDFQWVGGLYYSNLHSGYVTQNQALGFVTTPACPQTIPYPLGGHCPAGDQFNFAPPVTGPNPTGIMFNDNNPNILTQKAIFGEASYKLSPTLKLTTGLRFYKFTIGNQANQRGLGTASGDATPTIDSASGTNTSLLPKVNLSYEPTSDLTLYSTISKGSRPGGVNLPIPLVPFSQGAFYYCGPGTGPSYLTSQPAYYAPDDIWSVEMGEKARFADRRFTVNADVFYVKWHNIQQLVVLSCGYPYNTNVGDAKTYGPEVEMAAKVTDAITVNLSGAYTQAYISNPTGTPGLPVYSGTRITSIPKYTGDLAVNYETMLGQDFKLAMRLSESYVGPIEDTAYFREELGKYGLMDFRLGVGKEAWTASFFGTNLTNKHAGLTIDNTVFAWQQPTITRVSTNQPRTIGLAFETKF